MKAREHKELAFEGDAVVVKGTRKKRHMSIVYTDGGEPVKNTLRTRTVALLDRDGLALDQSVLKKGKKRRRRSPRSVSSLVTRNPSPSLRVLR